MAEVTDGSLGGLKSVKYLEVVLGVQNFDYFFFFFDYWLGRSYFYLG